MNVGRLNAVLGLNTKEFEQGMKGAMQGAGNLGKTLMKIGGAFGVAFGGREVLRTMSQMSNLASETETVKAAFDRLDDPNLLRNLEQATLGTVSKLELMKQAVTATNFKISTDVLAKGLAFATMRARETGQEVDYLVNSFVVGMGRKSTMVLDNLGLSLIEIQKEVKKVGDFSTAVGNIIEREMVNAGEVTLSTAEKTAQLGKSWEDLKPVLGGLINNYINPYIEKLLEANDLITFMGDKHGYAAKKIVDAFEDEALAGKSQEDQLKALGTITDEYNKKLDTAIKNIAIWEQWGEESSKTFQDQAMTYLEVIRILGILEESMSKVSGGGEQLGKIESLTIQLEALKLALPKATEASEIKEISTEIYNLEQQIKELTDLTPEIEGMTKIQSKSAQVTVDGLGEVSEALHETSEGWAVYVADMTKINAEIELAMNSIRDVFINSATDMMFSIGELMGSQGDWKQFWGSLIDIAVDAARQIGGIFMALGLAMKALSGGTLGSSYIVAGAALMGAGALAGGIASGVRGNRSMSPSAGEAKVFAPVGVASTQQMNVKVSGQLAGRDINISNDRGGAFQHAVT